MENGNLQIECLQSNLLTIRRITGWTAEQLGRKIGVTKQTISNLENQKTPMTLTQYIALRTVFDYEIKKNPTNTVLKEALERLVDRADSFNEIDRQKISEAYRAVATTTFSGLGFAQFAFVAGGIIKALVGPIISLINDTSSKNQTDWMKKLEDKNQDNNNIGKES